MEKKKEDGMTDLEIIKKNFNIITESEGYDYWYELEKEAIDAATRMAAEIERLKKELNTKRTYNFKMTKKELLKELHDADEHNLNLQREIERLKAAFAEKPDIVRCGECSNLVINDNAKYCGICLDAKRKRNDFCSRGTRREAKDED